jgi:hypothetical protein
MQLNMKDTHETNLPQEETGKLEETKAPEIIPENAGEEIPAGENIVATDATGEPVPNGSSEESEPEKKLPTKEEILERLTELINTSTRTARNEIESLKEVFHKIHKMEVGELKKSFLEAGGEEKDFLPPPEDHTETKIKNLLNIYKEKKAALHAEEEQRKAANYALKLQLISRIKELTESQDDFNKLYNEFKEIQQRWKEAKAVPQEHANELWKNYQIYSERFYDLIKINHQFRDYDFKKNLEMKTILCETVEKLANEPEVVSAFHQLQKLHQQWREIGPVAKDLREDLWARFKTASLAVNKRHQEYFESLRAREQENQEIKTAICEQVEKIDYSLLKTIRNWEEKTREIIGLQAKWKHTGSAAGKQNIKLSARFRAACDAFFNKKTEFFKALKGEMDKNLELKRALCEKAEALKDSTDWKETTEQLIALQKEWRTIGSIPRKFSDVLWKRFISSCDYFFEQKNQNVSSQRNTEQTNLAAKKELVKKINALDEVAEHDEALSLIRDYMSEWNSIGFVPFKEKDKLSKDFHEAIDKQFERLKVDQNDRKMQSFRNSLNDLAGGEKGKGKLYGERDKLMRTYERMKSELQTYENNFGFLSSSSKGGSGLIKEMERRMENLKDEMKLLVKKIDAIDENLE